MLRALGLRGGEHVLMWLRASCCVWRDPLTWTHLAAWLLLWCKPWCACCCAEVLAWCDAGPHIFLQHALIHISEVFLQHLHLIVGVQRSEIVPLTFLLRMGEMGWRNGDEEDAGEKGRGGEEGAGGGAEAEERRGGEGEVRGR